MSALGNNLRKIGLLAILLLPKPAFSFKVDTHVWIAQQVINDLRSNSNKLSLPTRDLGVLFGELDVGTARDIVDYPAYFRMGAIGPDAFPGILEGQMIIHPGADDHRWGTGKWIQHLLSKAQPGKERAFVLGFICHAAADIFAHTYVNTYSGGEFDLNNGYEEEERHYTLESYISERSPKILNEKGEYLGEAHQLVMDGNQPAVPVDFVMNHMLFGDDAIAQFQGKPSAIFGAMKSTKDRLDHLLRRGGEIDQMESEVIKFLALQQAGLKLNNEQAQKLVDLLKEVQDFKDKTAEGMKKLVKSSSKALGEVQNVQNKIEQAQIKLLENTSEKGLEFAQKTLESQIKIAEYSRQLAEVVVKECINLCETEIVEEKVCSTKNPLGCLTWIINKTPVLLFPAECATCNAVHDSGVLKKKNLQNLLDAERKIYDKAQKELDKTFDEIKKAHQELINARLATLKFTETLIIEAIEQTRIATSINPVREILQSWSQNIELVGREYIKANVQVIVNTIQPNSSSKFDPLMDWVECQLPKAAGIPGVFPNVSCAVEDYSSKMIAAFENIKKSTLYSIPLVREVVAKLDELEKHVKTQVKEETMKQLSKLIKVDVKHLYEIISKKVDDKELDASFMNMSHLSKKGLIVFTKQGQRMSDRVKSEMRLTEEGLFNDKFYTVVLNAVKLSKLSLIDGKHLLNLIQKMGISPDSSPQDWNALNINLPGALLLNSIRSIDGNHQWIQSAPSLPKSEGWGRNFCRSKRFAMQFAQTEAIHAESCAGSGYSEFEYHESPQHGFRLFMNSGMRTAVFNRFFTEILAPGIEAPKTLNSDFDEVLPADYEYRVCEKQPFPNGNPKDSVCAEQVLDVQMKALYGENKVPAEVLTLVQEKVGQSSYASLKPLFDYEAVHYKFKEENASSEGELREMLSKQATWQQEVAIFQSIKNDVLMISTDVLNSSSHARAAEDKLIKIRSTLRAAYCDGKIHGYRDIKSFHDLSMASYRGLAFKGMVSRINFKDLDYFAGKANEHVELIEHRYTSIETINKAAQSDFNSLYVERLCKDVDVLLLHLGVEIDNAAITDLIRELADLKKRIESDSDSSSQSELSAEDSIRMIKSRVIDSLLQENYASALESYSQGIIELQQLERSLATPMANYKSLMDAIQATRATLSDIYQQQLQPVVLRTRIQKEEKEFDENAELIDALAMPGSIEADTWKAQVSREPGDESASASLEELAAILQYYVDSNKLAEKILKGIE